MHRVTDKIYRGVPNVSTRTWMALAFLMNACASRQTERMVVQGPVVVASARACSGRLDNRVRLLTEGDAAMLAKIFGSANVLDNDPAPDDVDRIASGGENWRGLLLFYSGHGQYSDHVGTTLCLNDSGGEKFQNGKLPVRDLYPALRKNTSPWKVVVLNSCASAHVDLREAPAAFSVISAGHDADPG